jgi:cell division protein YceG involved in septum cleavage
MSPTSFLSSRWLRVLLGVGVTALVVVVTAQGLARVIGGAVGENGEDSETVSIAPNLDVEITVPPGASARQIGSILAEAGVIDSANEFELRCATRGSPISSGPARISWSRAWGSTQSSRSSCEARWPMPTG